MGDSAAISTSVLGTASAVIDAVGGTLAASRLTGSSMPSVSGWRASGRLPPKTFLLLTEALAALGKSAPSTLWGIDPARNGGGA